MLLLLMLVSSRIADRASPSEMPERKSMHSVDMSSGKQKPSKYNAFSLSSTIGLNCLNAAITCPLIEATELSNLVAAVRNTSCVKIARGQHFMRRKGEGQKFDNEAVSLCSLPTVGSIIV